MRLPSVSKDFKQSGDTHFAFIIPEASNEDSDLLGKLIEKEFISQHLAACLFMVDFSNPVFSKARAHLVRYIPQAVIPGKGGADLDLKFIDNVISSQQHKIPGTPESELYNNWVEGKWQEVFSNRISSFFAVILSKTSTSVGFADIMKLAASRRYQFSRMPLYEFDLTFSFTNISNSLFPLEITPEGVVQQVS